MKKINRNDWQLHFTRFRCPLIASAIQGGWARYVSPVENIIVNSSEIYFNKKQYQDCVRLFNKKIEEDSNFLLSITKKAYFRFKERKIFLREFESVDFTKLGVKELITVFSELFEWLYQWNTENIQSATMAEDFLILQLEQELGRYIDPTKNFEKFQELQLLFTTPAKVGFLEEYEAKLRREIECLRAGG